MKTRAIAILLTTILMGSLLMACSSNKEASSTPAPTTEASASPEASPSAEPSPSEEPTPSEAPTPSEEQSPSAEPTASPVPAATKKPEPTKAPVATKKPEATKAPAPSKKPDPTKAPVPTKKPEPTKTPAPTKEPIVEAMPSVKEMMDEMLSQVEQPSLMVMNGDDLKSMYDLDAALLEEFTVRFPMMNVKATEVSIFNVKNAKDIDTVKAGIKKRATNIQKSFESYLPDQYENAKNYKIITKDNYVLFIISDRADDLENVFHSFFNKK